MTITVPLLAGAMLVAFVAILGLPILRDRRVRRLAARDVQARVAELDRRPPPDALPKARDLTKAETRHLRGRGHPIAKKRRTGRWG